MSGIDWPLERNIIRGNSIRHTFGMVRRNGDGSARPHQGWDFAAPVGTPCFAIADGEVALVRDAGAYGKQLSLRFAHDFDGDGEVDTLFAFYSHLSRIDVEQGQRVTKGTHLGLTGESGNARGMPASQQHLHFEIRTKAFAGRGLASRFSPLAVFGLCPLREAAYRVATLQGCR